mmetsp:Transcript_7989/g.49332  ORF Transcript_7989/g.49332 Transcript_7989/m.49332 type:complete len:265 (-) Transcript_7989:2751-3545(-)
MSGPCLQHPDCARYPSPTRKTSYWQHLQPLCQIHSDGRPFLHDLGLVYLVESSSCHLQIAQRDLFLRFVQMAKFSGNLLLQLHGFHSFRLQYMGHSLSEGHTLNFFLIERASSPKRDYLHHHVDLVPRLNHIPASLCLRSSPSWTYGSCSRSYHVVLNRIQRSVFYPLKGERLSHPHTCWQVQILFFFGWAHQTKHYSPRDEPSCGSPTVQRSLQFERLLDRLQGCSRATQEHSPKAPMAQAGCSSRHTPRVEKHAKRGQSSVQ